MSIKLQDVCFSVDSFSVFWELNLCIKEKQKTIVYYESGDGATLLCKLICGLVLPESGSVFVFEKQSSPKNGYVTFLPKNQLFFDKKSAFSNLLWAAHMSSKKTNNSQIILLLKKYNILPHEKPKNMNRFERLKLALARSEMLKKQVVIVDDIFFGLSASEQKLAKKLFFEYAKDKTVVFLCSDKSFSPKGYQKKCLCFGKVFDVPKKPDDACVFVARRISAPHEKFEKAICIIKNENVYLKIGKENIKLTYDQEELMKSKMADNVFLILNEDNRVVSAFDAMDRQKIW